MAMPDASRALVALLEPPAGTLTSTVYNVRAFAATAGEWAARVRKAFPAARITFAPDPRRQAIVDSWPEELDDTRARRDWGFAPRHDFGGALDDYLIPAIRHRYGG